MQHAVTVVRAPGLATPKLATLGFLSPGQTHYIQAMQGGPFRRLVAALAVVTLLLAGFAAASVAAETPCVMPMAGSIPCDDGHQDNTPDDHKQPPPALACFAKCPVPVLDRVVGPVAVVTFVQPVVWTSLHAAPAGIGVAPPLHPPRA